MERERGGEREREEEKGREREREEMVCVRRRCITTWHRVKLVGSEVLCHHGNRHDFRGLCVRAQAEALCVSAYVCVSVCVCVCVWTTLPQMMTLNRRVWWERVCVCVCV